MRAEAISTGSAFSFSQVYSGHFWLQVRPVPTLVKHLPLLSRFVPLQYSDKPPFPFAPPMIFLYLAVPVSPEEPPIRIKIPSFINSPVIPLAHLGFLSNPWPPTKIMTGSFGISPAVTRIQCFQIPHWSLPGTGPALMAIQGLLPAA